MNDRTVTTKQFSAAVFAALLSPLMRVLPRTTAEIAGKASWLCVIPAFFVLVILAALMASLRRQTPAGEGMADVVMRFFGPVFGRMLLILYGIWFLVYAGFILRSGAVRLTAAVYQHSDAEPFIVIMLVLCLIASLGTMRAAVRTGGLFKAILLVSLALVCVFSLSNLSYKNLLPLRLTDAAGSLMGAWPVWTVGSVAALFSFLNAYEAPPEKPFRRFLLLLVLFCAVACVICIEPTATFGPALTAKLSYPFFTMIRDITLFGLSQRFEAVVIVLWVFADFILCTLLLRCAHEAFRTILRMPKPEGASCFDLRKGRWILLLEAPAVYGFSLILSGSPDGFLFWSQTMIPLLMNVSVFGGFTLIWIVGRLRGKFQ